MDQSIDARFPHFTSTCDNSHGQCLSELGNAKITACYPTNKASSGCSLMNIPAIRCFVLQPKASNLCVWSSLSDRGPRGASARPSAIHFSSTKNEATTLDRNRFWKHFSFSKVPLGKFPSRSGMFLLKKSGPLSAFLGRRRVGKRRCPKSWRLNSLLVKRGMSF